MDSLASFWRRAFDADPSVLGRTVLVQDRPVQIVGVAPRGFRGLALDSGPDVYLPLHAIEQIQSYDHLFDDGPPLYWVHLIGRMPDGLSLPATQERLAGVRLGPKQNRSVVLTDLQTAAVPELAMEEEPVVIPELLAVGLCQDPKARRWRHRVEARRVPTGLAPQDRVRPRRRSGLPGASRGALTRLWRGSTPARHGSRNGGGRRVEAPTRSRTALTGRNSRH